MDSTRRTVLKAGVAAAAAAAVLRIFAQQAGNAGKFYEKGPVRIYYEEAGSGFPLLLLPGGGLNANIGFFTGNVFAGFFALSFFTKTFGTGYQVIFFFHFGQLITYQSFCTILRWRYTFRSYRGRLFQPRVFFF